MSALQDFSNHLPPETEKRLRAIRQSRKDFEEGKFVPYEEVRNWLLSWGTKNPIPAPKVKSK